MSFEESKHPRVPEGKGSHGGEFASKELAYGQAAYDTDKIRGTFEPSEEEAISDWSSTSGTDETIRERPWTVEGKSFRSALSKIPPHSGLVYRGMDDRSRQKFDNVKPGDHVVMDKLRSWSREENVAMDFTDPDGRDAHTVPGVLIRVRCNRSELFKDITPFMVEEHQWGKEVVSEEGTTLRVVSLQKNVNHEFTVVNQFLDTFGKKRTRLVHIIEMEEV